MGWLGQQLYGIRKILLAGVELAERGSLNFASGFTVVDNPLTGRTDVSVSGASGDATVASASVLLTSGAATTVLTLAALPDGVSVVDIYARASTAGDLAVWARKRSCVVRRTASGNVTIVGASADPDAVSEAATASFAAAFVASGTSLLVQCTGAAYWSVTAQVLGANNPNPAPPGPLPDLVSLLPTSGPTAGGTSVVLTGTDFTGATAVSFGGVAAASFTVDSSTQITAVTPALTAGAKDVSVTTPYGTDTLAASFTASAFTLAGLAWELWLQGSSRSSTQIIGTASAGGSGTSPRKLTSTGGNAIAAGTLFNGRPSVDWNTDSMWTFGNVTLADVVSASAAEFTVIFAIVVNTYTATGTQYYNVPRIFGTTSGSYFGIGAYNDGGTGKIIAGVYDGSYKSVKAALTTATRQVVAFRLKADGTLGIKIGAASWVTLAGVGPIASTVDYLTNYSSATPNFVDGDVEQLLMAKVALSDGDVDSAMAAIAALDGITL